ncbi:RNA exonuclease 4-like isoform X2 [Phoenix dactylifera]|uniref:RNA exonuclease 4 n=1 Tax=Phoenix dactylifera TaxID=42345 RepID=A0A8B9AP75_PHODC|nr:RNA exonuclease 4-like isoform X2 [Phoenix dactylifera]
MDLDPQPEPTITRRHKCSACYQQFKKKEHLVEHMRVSYHSIHEPKCGVCNKHCRTLASVREHLIGPLPKRHCAEVFAASGCDLCLNILESANALRLHKDLCRLSPAYHAETDMPSLIMGSNGNQVPEVVAMDCEMVGGGSDGSLDLCARVCLIDENENVIFHSYVKPIIPVTNFRFEITGITEDHLVDGMPLLEVRKKIEKILYNGESISRARLEGGNARILVGHDLDHDLDCLKMNYPPHLIRDTAQYRPLKRTNDSVSFSLKYLTQTYLGYEIQNGTHDPYEDCVAALRLYKRMRSQIHQTEFLTSNESNVTFDTKAYNCFDSSRLKGLVKMSPDDLLGMSVADYRCWCLDRSQNS